MLGDIAHDYRILCPGELVAGVVVYPLPVISFVTMPGPVNAIFESINLWKQRPLEPLPLPPDSAVVLEPAEPAVAFPTFDELLTTALTGPAWPLLQACCVPPPADPSAANVREICASWTRQSIPPDLIDLDTPQPVDDGDEPILLKFRTVIGLLVAHGHSVADILHTQHVGAAGVPIPYAGISLRMLDYYWKAALAVEARNTAGQAEAVAGAVSAAFGDDGGRSFETFVTKLYSK